MRIVIADDERLSRVNLLNLIERCSEPWEVVGEAANGEEMVKLIEKHLPDIAIVDIRMPRMDGLEAIEAGRKLSPTTQWIILTGFSDFSYAHQALKLGASEYLLKPVRPEELERTLNLVSKDNKQFKLLMNKQFENDLMALSHGLTMLMHEPPHSIFRLGLFRGYIIYMDSALSGLALSNWQSEFTRNLRTHLNDLNHCGFYTALFMLPGGELAAVGTRDPAIGEQAIIKSGEFARTIEKYLHDYQDSPVKVTVFKSEECESYEFMQEKLEFLKYNSCYRSVYGINRLWTYQAFAQLEENKALWDIAKQLIELSLAYKNKVYVHFQNGIVNLDKKINQLQLSATQPELINNIAEYIVSTLNIQRDRIKDFPSLIQQLKICGDRLLEDSQSGENWLNRLVDQVITMIDKNYMDDIGLGTIAGELDITQNYLSYLFHKKTGTTFMKYLTRIRILKAKALLCETNLQVQEVANHVGYYSARHFSKLFKESVGCHPSEYRKKFEVH